MDPSLKVCQEQVLGGFLVRAAQLHEGPSSNPLGSKRRTWPQQGRYALIWSARTRPTWPACDGLLFGQMEAQLDHRRTGDHCRTIIATPDG